MTDTTSSPTSLLVDSLRSTAELLRGHEDKPFDHATMAILLECAADEIAALRRKAPIDTPKWFIVVPAPMCGHTTYIGPFDTAEEATPKAAEVGGGVQPMYPPDIPRDAVWNYPQTMIDLLEIPNE